MGNQGARGEKGEKGKLLKKAIMKSKNMLAINRMSDDDISWHFENQRNRLFIHIFFCNVLV